jgi:hypothetical protein
VDGCETGKGRDSVQSKREQHNRAASKNRRGRWSLRGGWEKAGKDCNMEGGENGGEGDGGKKREAEFVSEGEDYVGVRAG